MKYVSLDQFGRVAGLMFLSDLIEGDDFIEAPDYINKDNFHQFFYSFSEKEFKQLPLQPSIFHVFHNNSWVFDRDISTSRLIESINMNRRLKMSQPIVYFSENFDSNQTAITNIQSTILVFQSTKQLPEGFVWRTFDNQLVPMTYEKLEGLAQAIYARNAQIYAESWALKDSLPNKTDDELLALYESLTQATPG